MLELFPLIKLLTLAFVSFGLAIAATPILTHYLYKYKFWKSKARTTTIDGRPAEIFNKLHAEKEVGTPRAGGLLIWVTILAVVFLAWLFAFLFPQYSEWNILNRSETWLPLFTLAAAGVIGFIDDFAVVKGSGKYIGGGISSKLRIALVLGIGAIGAWWFVAKLGFDTIFIPFAGNIFIGWLIAPLFILVLLATFSSGVVDGLDGLSGGVFATIFATFGAIAFIRGQFELATLCAVLLGALLAYLWFNIPPARFYMGETGILALTTTVTVVAFLTNSVLLLPIAGIILVAEAGSVILQLTSKKLRGGKKIFLVAPLHHHFEAKGWPAYKVVMRFWVISSVFCFLALLLFLVGPR